MQRIDVLNRDKFVDGLFQVVENISDNKVSTCFALNGEWGSGKSFVLDMFEEKLTEIQFGDTFTEKYFVIRYNSWKYDYYEEPLVAIVATMISTIEEKTKLFPDSQEKQEALGMLKAVGVSLLSLGNMVVKEKTGMDFQNAYETVLKGEKSGAEAYAKEHEYDVYFGFNKVMDKLTTLLRKLAEKYTIVIIVDELDRCLPEYAIKVLERLHHLTGNNGNTITIIAIDKEQLKSIVKQIFGFENPERYLEKFFNFEVKLDYGKTSEKIMEKYSSYINLFDKHIFPFDESVEECLQNIFKDINIRTQEQIVKKVMLTHKLLYADQKKDYSFMCMELILAVMLLIYDNEAGMLKNTVDIDDLENIFTTPNGKNKIAFSTFFKEKFEQTLFESRRNFSGELISYILPIKANLYGAIIFTWYWMHEKNKKTIIQSTGDSYEVISHNHEELKKFVETITMMR